MSQHSPFEPRSQLLPYGNAPDTDEKGLPISSHLHNVNTCTNHHTVYSKQVRPPPTGVAPAPVATVPQSSEASPRQHLPRNVDSGAWVYPLDSRYDSVHATISVRTESPARSTSTNNSRLHTQERQLPSRLTPVHTKSTHTTKTTTKIAHRRAQCRANQARYRERQRQKKADAEEETACLRELVGLLEIQRTLMRATQNPDFEYVHHAVTSFFRQFRRGVAGASDDDVAMSELLVGDRASARAPTWTKVGRAGRNVSLLRQIAFVRCVVSEDAEFGGDSDGGARGPDAVLEQCWRYSALHSNPWVQLLTIHRSSSLSRGVEHVVATAQLTVGITKQTLAVVFPGVRPRLGKKLLGKKVEYSVQFDLEFARAGVGELLQLVWATTRIDVVGSLLKVLGDPSEVEEVVRCARISMHGYIGGR